MARLIRVGSAVLLAALAAALGGGSATAQGTGQDGAATSAGEGEQLIAIRAGTPPDDDDAGEGEGGARGARYDPHHDEAEGDAYFYRQLVAALVVVALMGAFLVWFVRRQSRGK